MEGLFRSILIVFTKLGHRTKFWLSLFPIFQDLLGANPIMFRSFIMLAIFEAISTILTGWGAVGSVGMSGSNKMTNRWNNALSVVLFLKFERERII